MSGFTLTSPTVANYLRYLARVKAATDADAEAALGVTRSAICAARVFCQGVGLVEWSGDKEQIPTGQPPKVWRLTEAGERRMKG